jgi:FtsP/CotA-like multicopper oxidase with cupredoxin domain
MGVKPALMRRATVVAGVAAMFWPSLAGVKAQSLSPYAITKYQTAMLIPPVMPQATGTVSGIDYYEISVLQFSQQILPAGFPATPVWGYGTASSANPSVPVNHNSPSLTIEATAERPVRIKWINGLKDINGDYRPHLLSVDQTLHWANPPGGIDFRDTRPVFNSTPLPYTGPVPMVTHVHGAVGVGDESDGYAEAWYLPDARNIPPKYATEGTWYSFFKTKASDKFGATWGPGFAIQQYPNKDRASANWYHDHTLGMTRVNVYAGPAGFYIIRGGPSGDNFVLDTRTNVAANLPGPPPKPGDPAGTKYYEIPIAIQDRSFNTDGSLFYPTTRAFFDGIAGPYIPTSDVSPIWNPEFFGNTIMVNGNTWPFLTVEQRRYRLRLLNGCQSRFLILDFGKVKGVDVWVIGNEGGFLQAPVSLTTLYGNQLLISPAERFDVIVDFGKVKLGNYELENVGPDAPFAGKPIKKADPRSTGKILQFRVVASTATPDPTTPPQNLQLPVITPLGTETRTRRLALLENNSINFAGAPAEVLLGTVDETKPQCLPNTPCAWTKRLWAEPVTENPARNAVEVWEFYNGTPDAHPIHVHEVAFEVVSRQNIFVNGALQTFELVPGSVRIPPEPWETGVKDTVIAYPNQVTRIKARFADQPGQFVWHCHIVEHEDNEMMRPYRVGPVQSGQPGSAQLTQVSAAVPAESARNPACRKKLERCTKKKDCCGGLTCRKGRCRRR